MTNIKKCIGCGIELQSKDLNKAGYIRENKYETASYCEKCFKIKNYGQPKEEQINLDTSKVINDINAFNFPIIFTIDVLTLSEDSVKYLNCFKNNKKYILLTKCDLLPKSLKEGKIVKYFKDNFYEKAEVFCVSNKNYDNIEKLMNKIKKDKINDVYIVGNTNSGKSTIINTLLKMNNKIPFVTVSPINNTTVSYLNIALDDINLTDTPGFEFNSISNYLSGKTLLNITPKKELKVKTFQMLSGYSIIVDNILRIDYNEGELNSFNFYMNNNLSFKKIKIKNNNNLITLPNKTFNLSNEDIVINGMGFIKINRDANVTVYSLDEGIINTRIKMI